MNVANGQHALSHKMAICSGEEITGRFFICKISFVAFTLHRSCAKFNLFCFYKTTFYLDQWFPTGEEFLPREEFHEFRGGISTFYLSYLFVVQ